MPRYVLTLLSLLLLPYRAFAFPEMVRHNYVNCTSCHVSPSGGGVLTEYGRELSREILSTWGTKNETESKFAYGVVTPPDWLALMGMYRGVEAYQNTPFVQQAKYIYMQGDLEGAATIAKKLIIDATLGYDNQPDENTAWDHVISRRHYINYRPTDELSFRFGRFYPDFGINTPDHVIATKRYLGFDEGMETYNLEAAYIGDKYNLYVTGDFGRIDKPSLGREQGVVVTPSIAVADHYKVGVSYFYGNSRTTTRNVGGPWGILGFTPHFFLLSEVYAQESDDKGGAFSGRFGLADYQRLDYEVIQGLHAYLTQDFAQLNWSDALSRYNSFGVGVRCNKILSTSRA